MASDRDPPPGKPVPGAPAPTDADAGAGAGDRDASDDITITQAIPERIGDSESQPIAGLGRPQSGRLRAATQGAVDRSRRVAGALVGGGVTRLGAGVEKVGDGVARLAHATRKVPLVGAGVRQIGEGISSIGDVMQELPRVAKTQRGRLLVRSMIVGFALVFLWIAAIVGLQLWGNDTTDFRPDAERILVTLSKGGKAIEDLYDHASPRFQEIVRKERFVDDMTDMNATVGKYREITAVNDTLETTGPAGRIGRVSITVAYEKATCKDNVSFHFDQGEWKLLGIGVELPSELHITEADRKGRVAGCTEDERGHPCEVRGVAEHVLTALREGKVDEVYLAATPVFQQVMKQDAFRQLNQERIAAVGKYKRIVSVTDSRIVDGQKAIFDCLVEYDRGIVAVTFHFYRADADASGKLPPWRLSGFKAVLPLPATGPRGPEHVIQAPTPERVSGDAGVPSDAVIHD